MDEIEWWEFESRAEMAEQVAGDIGFVIESAIEAHGDARVAGHAPILPPAGSSGRSGRGLLPGEGVVGQPARQQVDGERGATDAAGAAGSRDFARLEAFQQDEVENFAV